MEHKEAILHKSMELLTHRHKSCCPQAGSRAGSRSSSWQGCPRSSASSPRCSPCTRSGHSGPGARPPSWGSPASCHRPCSEGYTCRLHTRTRFSGHTWERGTCSSPHRSRLGTRHDLSSAGGRGCRPGSGTGTGQACRSRCGT